MGVHECKIFKEWSAGVLLQILCSKAFTTSRTPSSCWTSKTKAWLTLTSSSTLKSMLCCPWIWAVLHAQRRSSAYTFAPYTAHGILSLQSPFSLLSPELKSPRAVEIRRLHHSAPPLPLESRNSKYQALLQDILSCKMLQIGRRCTWCTGRFSTSKKWSRAFSHWQKHSDACRSFSQNTGSQRSSINITLENGGEKKLSQLEANRSRAFVKESNLSWQLVIEQLQRITMISR